MAEYQHAAARGGAATGHRWLRRIRVDDDRVFYCGDFGRPSLKRSGAINVYVGLEAPLRCCFDGRTWQSAECVVAQPFVAQRLATEGRTICDFMIEPESVDVGALPAFLRASGPVLAPAFVERVRAVAQGQPLGDRIDVCLLGRTLAPRLMDPRVSWVIGLLQREPNSALEAQDFAERSGLSLSRFLHLFKEQSGCAYRTFRAWKRARMLLPRINRPQNLARLAQEIGYPDSSHFSHSIRQYFGISPKDILSGCRKVQVVACEPVSGVRAQHAA